MTAVVVTPNSYPDVCTSETIQTEAVPQCNVCGSGEFDEFATGYDYELQTCRNAWRFVQCSQCGHVWLNPRPAIAAIPIIYPSTYYAYSYATKINRIAVAGKALLDRLKLKSIWKRLGRAPQSYVDVGCGEGRFLKSMERKGIPRERLYGLDLDERSVGELQQAGYQAYCSRVEDCTAIPTQSIDVATMFHVIEHVADPAGVIRQLADWLSPGGLLAIETPNIESLDARLFHKTFWGGYHIPRHWHLFSTDTLVASVRQAGLEVVATKYQTGHSFWMYSLHHWLRYGRPQLPGIARFFDPFGNLVPLVMATGFDKLRAAVGFRTSAVLVIARKARHQDSTAPTATAADRPD